MEDGISSILYILISVIIVLVGVLRKKKKPQQVPGGSGNSETGGMDFFDKLGLKDTNEVKEEFADIEEEETKEPDEKEQQGITITPTFEDQPEYKPEVTEKVAEEESEEVNTYEISDKYDEELNEIRDEFDLKRAIIYSEIINKKYE